MRKGKQYHLPFNIKAVGKNTKLGKGKGTDNSGKKIEILKNRGGEEYRNVGNFIPSGQYCGSSFRIRGSRFRPVEDIQNTIE